MKRYATSGPFIVLSAIFFIAGLALAQHGYVERQSFKAFYCAGTAVLERRDPYRVEPLSTCEHRIAPEMPAAEVEPAPLPGYALLPFAALATLPVRAASIVYVMALGLATIVAAGLLARLLPAPPSLTLFAIAPLALLNVAYGEAAPIALAGMCASAYLLTKRRWNAAAGCSCVVLLQPNVGIAVVAAVFAFVPRARLAIATCVAVLAVASVVAIGPARNVEYVQSVIPSQAASELDAADQYSFSHVLAMAGATPEQSLLWGKGAYALALASGIALGGFLALRKGWLDVVPLIPAAAVLAGGIYVHDITMIFAVPAALVIAKRSHGMVPRSIAAAAAAVLVMVWTQRAGRAVVLLDLAGVFAAVAAILDGDLVKRTALAGAAALALTLAAQRLTDAPASMQIVTRPFTVTSDELASDAWASYLRATPVLTRQVVAVKVPTWAGLSGVLFCAILILYASREPLPAISW